MFFLKKFRLLFNIFILIGITFVVGFTIYKLAHSNKKYPQEKSLPKFNTVSTHWEKNNFIVSSNNILLLKSENISVGEYYFLTQSIETKQSPEKCFMGYLKLISIKKDRYIFYSPKIFDRSNLFKYAQFNSYETMIIPKTKDQFLKENQLENCQNWIKLINHNNENNSTLIEEKSTHLKIQKIQIQVKKCIKIPSKKFLVVESSNSNVFHLDQNKLFNQINLCANFTGSSLIKFQPLNGSSHFIIEAKAFSKEKASIKSKRKETQFNPSHSFFRKNLPGWQ